MWPSRATLDINTNIHTTAPPSIRQKLCKFSVKKWGKTKIDSRRKADQCGELKTW